ncbi:SGNH/GDSL hydrolase family protein [Cyclobacterium sediminis]
MIRYRLLFKYLSIGLLFSCQYEFPEPGQLSPDPGQADFSKMVTIGSSITAGVMDAALYNRSQQNSYAVILATQMKETGGGDFNVPEINAENGDLILSPTGGALGRLILTLNQNTGSILPTPIVPGDALTTFSGDKTALNNFGVNGLTLAQALLPASGNIQESSNPLFNPYYARFASNPGNSTPIGDAASALADGGTFFVFWLGKNDVLPYALTGGAIPELLTSEQDFSLRYQTALGTMLQASPEAKGAIGNIPNINELPYFSTVPWNALPLDNFLAGLANSVFTNYNSGLDNLATAGMISDAERDLRKINFSAGQNGFLIDDKTLTDLSEMGLPPIRQTNVNDKVALTTGQILGSNSGDDPTLIYGVTVPIADNYIMLPSEQAEMEAQINAFNQIIATTVSANENRLVLVDTKNLLERIGQGALTANDIAISNSILPPYGVFSTDGVHPNARGSAVVANHFIEAINGKWNSTIPVANPNAYIGNDLPR